MRWTSAVSEEFNLTDALSETISLVKADLGNDPPDLAVVFVSPHHAVDYDTIPTMLKEKLGARQVIGCSGGGVIGAGREVEEQTGLSLTVAHLPGVKIETIHLEHGDLPDQDAPPNAWESAMGISSDGKPQFVILADPFSIQTEQLLSGLDYTYSGSAKIGGLASGGTKPGQNVLFIGDKVFRSGVVILSLQGDIEVDTIVGQGCRPIGDPLVVTKCDQNHIIKLDDRIPMDVISEIFEASDERDQNLINTALHLGIVTDPLLEDYGAGDFLIRNVLGIDRETQGLYVGEQLREGQVVQLHVRDGTTAEDDLRAVLQRYRAEASNVMGAGALLFSCLGRGRHLFGKADHDTKLFLDEVGEIPLGGFFCNGEIGPVGATTFLHGFTSSFGIFRPVET